MSRKVFIMCSFAILILNIITQKEFEKAFYRNVKIVDFSKQAEVINKYQDVITKLAERTNINIPSEEVPIGSTSNNITRDKIIIGKEESRNLDDDKTKFSHSKPPYEHSKEHLDQESEEYEKLREGHSVSVGFLILLKQLGLAELAANLLWIQMDADFHAGLWHRGRFALELIPKLDPTFIEAYLLLAFTYTNEQKHKESLELLEKVAIEYPNRYEIFEQLGIQYYNSTGRYGKERYIEKALVVFRYIVTNFADVPHHFHRFIAKALVELGKVDEAINYLQNVLKTFSNSNLPDYQIDKYNELLNQIKSEYNRKFEYSNSSESKSLTHGNDGYLGGGSSYIFSSDNLFPTRGLEISSITESQK